MQGKLYGKLLIFALRSCSQLWLPLEKAGKASLEEVVCISICNSKGNGPCQGNRKCLKVLAIVTLCLFIDLRHQRESSFSSCDSSSSCKNFS